MFVLIFFPLKQAERLFLTTQYKQDSWYAWMGFGIQ